MLVVVALVLALVIKSFAIQAFFIPSASMENTLDDQRPGPDQQGRLPPAVDPPRRHRRVRRQRLLGLQTARRPARNIFGKAVDELEGIVGISHDPHIYIKRVIGLPGDHVACCNTAGQVTVNGVPLSESSYLYPGNHAVRPRSSTSRCPPGSLWVMGDHRAISYDSRGHTGDPGGGSIPESAVLGRAFVIIWPPSRWGFLNIPATFEQPRLNASNAAAGGSARGPGSGARQRHPGPPAAPRCRSPSASSARSRSPGCSAGPAGG